MRHRGIVTAASTLATGALLAFGATGAGAATMPPPPSAPAPVSTLVNTLKGVVAKVTGGATGTNAAGTNSLVPSVPDPPPPPGSASASGIDVPPLQTCISCTTATAGVGTGSASGRFVLLGQQLTGGTASTGQTAAGALIATPANPLLSLFIADWFATAGAGSAYARTALVDLSLGNGQVATLTVLQSQSAATNNGTTSTGRASNDGAVLNLGQGALVIVLLHSEASSTGTAKAYVVSINGNELITSGQTGGITINVPGVVTIHLLEASASGGAASAVIGTVGNLLGSTGLVLGLLESSAQGSPASSVPGSKVPPAGAVGLGLPAAEGVAAAPETGGAPGLVDGRHWGLIPTLAVAFLLAAAVIWRRRHHLRHGSDPVC